MRNVLFGVAAIALGLGLWSVAGAFRVAPVPSDGDAIAGNSAAAERARAAAVAMLAEAPLRSNLWLVLAAARAVLAPKAIEDPALEMAYLTGGEKAEDIPVRLRRAVQSPAFASQAVQDFVRGDVGLVIRRAPALRPMLGDVDRAARSDNRAGFEALVREADPALAASLAATAAGHR